MSDSSSNNHDRLLIRHLVNCDVDVYDSLRDLYLGRLVNIHRSGLMIVGEALLQEDKLYELDMHLPLENKVLRLGVDCLWTRAADEYKKYWTGFGIIDFSPEASEEIRKLIEMWCQS
jgi:PilZ domain